MLATIGLGAIPITLVFAQPDFGTALVYGAALPAVLFVGGARWLHLSVLAVAVAARWPCSGCSRPQASTS